MKIFPNTGTYNILEGVSGKSSDDTKKKAMKDAMTAIRQTKEAISLTKKEKSTVIKEKINKKISAGAKLTPQEMAYLQRTDPALYMRVKRIEMHREALENRLKGCKSKQQVEAVYSQALSMIREKDPDGQLLAKAFNDVLKEFKKTREYNSLPAEDKDEEAPKNIKGSH